MRIILFGAAGFIGTNLTLALVKRNDNEVTLVDSKEEYFKNINKFYFKNIKIIINSFDENTNFDELLKGQDIVYHLVSTTVPSTSNQKISRELISNVVVTSNMLDSCVRCGVNKVIFISSGGTVYGTASVCPLDESMETNPISSYGIHKITVEKLLYLYQYLYDLDYRVIRLSNPYGPYQRPSGILGAVTTFTYKALRNEKIMVFGDGSVVRDFIYIDDVVKAVMKIEDGNNQEKVFNVGCGYGTSINELLRLIEKTLNVELSIEYMPKRKVDVPVNYLNIERYEKAYGKLNPLPLKDGILRTAEFMREHYIR